MRRPIVAISGVAASESAMTTTTMSASARFISPSATAAPSRTNVNSLPWPISIPALMAVPQAMPWARATTVVTTVFARSNATVSPTTVPRRVTMRSSSTLIPTVMKNSPSSRPRKGWMSAATWWRYSVSASSIPATNPPMPSDRPNCAVPQLVPNSTSSITPVNSSGVAVNLNIPRNGRSTSRPTMKMITKAATALASVIVTVPAIAWVGPARAGTRDSSGTTARSCSSRTANATRPAREASSPRSARIWSTTAVDDKASPPPRITAARGPTPASVAVPPITAAASSNWPVPSPSRCRRMMRRRSSVISSPMVNISATTPSSAMPVVRSLLSTSPRTRGPTTAPATR